MSRRGRRITSRFCPRRILPFALYITLIELPVNDMWSNALPLSISQFYAYNNYATTEPGEPAEPFALGASVWWSLQPKPQRHPGADHLAADRLHLAGEQFPRHDPALHGIPTNDAYGNNTMVPIVQTCPPASHTG